jgi:hypothetical protein
MQAVLGFRKAIGLGKAVIDSLVFLISASNGQGILHPVPDICFPQDIDCSSFQHNGQKSAPGSFLIFPIPLTGILTPIRISSSISSYASLLTQFLFATVFRRY